MTNNTIALSLAPRNVELFVFRKAAPMITERPYFPSGNIFKLKVVCNARNFKIAVFNEIEQLVEHIDVYRTDNCIINF